MGVDCKVYLSPNVRVRDVASVAGKLAGLSSRRRESGRAWWVEVDGVAVEATPEPTMAWVTFGSRQVSYHFEGRDGWRLMIGRSTPQWVAVAKGLVDFFGGWVDYDDSDDVEVDYRQPEKGGRQNCPEDGDEWYVLQRRIEAVEPADSEWAKECAAYSESGDRK